jgi:feruloyl esterase
LTETEARVIDLIWDGPRTTTGDRLWGGITHGTSFDALLPGGNSMSALLETYLKNWVYEDPDFDWRSTITMGNFEENFNRSHRKFQELAASDDTNLAKLMLSNTKVITWHGTNDFLITPFGSYNYAERLFDRYGVEHTRDFVRTFFFPGVGHRYPVLNGSRSAQHQMMDALQRWVEDGQAPLVFDQALANGTKRKSCAYPDVLTTTVDGSTCVTADAVPEDLARESGASTDIR